MPIDHSIIGKKVICVKKNREDTPITIGKVYEVAFQYSNIGIDIVADNGQTWYLELSQFELYEPEAVKEDLCCVCGKPASIGIFSGLIKPPDDNKWYHWDCLYEVMQKKLADEQAKKDALIKWGDQVVKDIRVIKSIEDNLAYGSYRKMGSILSDWEVLKARLQL